VGGREAPSLRRQSLIAGGGRDAARASHLRPVITGCLRECGNRDQSCATQCQVCVEMSGCASLASEDCGACRAEVREARRWAETASAGTMDSGGRPMLREGAEMEFRHAHLSSLDAKRRLRHARGIILRAQRQAEWAHRENLEEVERLRESKTVLKRREEELKEWHQEHTERLRAMREELGERRGVLKRTERYLVRAKERLFRVRKRLGRFHAGKRHERWQHLEHEAEEAYERRRAEVREQRRSIKRIRLKLRMRKEDAKWLGQGLRREIEEARELVGRDLGQVEATRGLWEHSRRELERAKERYWEASDVSRQRDAAAQDLKHRLDGFAAAAELRTPSTTAPRL